MINHYLDKAIVSSLSIAANWQREVLLPKFFCSRAALLTTLRHAATGSRTGARARQMFSDNLDYVNYLVHIWYVNKAKCLYVDWLPHVVLLRGKNGAKMAKMTPPSRFLAPTPGPGQDTHERQNLARENQIG